MAEVAVTWLGDEDPSVQSINQYGHVFVKGIPTKVPEKGASMGKFKGNAYFTVGNEKGEVVASAEPDPVDPDAGTEKAALRTALDALGVEWDGRESAETLRGHLAKAQAKQAGHE
jgi:hypothetical protein